jgi:ribosome biogenesis GTPase
MTASNSLDSVFTAKAARVLSATRRHVDLLSDVGETLRGRLGSQVQQVVVGDNVRYVCEDSQVTVCEVVQRKNCFSRSTGHKRKELAANLDILFVVSAVSPPFNRIFVDRVLTIASVEKIKSILLVNKEDLGLKEVENAIGLYRSLGFAVIPMSALSGEAPDSLKDMLRDSNVINVAFCGISGVGKSTISNLFFPNKKITTGELSRKTGQGKQTTSQAQGYPIKELDCSLKILIDLPGVQSIGVGHLSPLEVAQSFPELTAAQGACQYRDCSHRSEPGCEVKEMVAQGIIASSRYDSYLQMLDEIERARPY